MKALVNLDRTILAKDIVLRLLSLYESKGKSYYYQTLFTKDLQSFSRKSLEDDIYSFAKFFNLDINDSRLKQLIKKDLVPKNKEEQYLKNIKQILSRIKEHQEDFELIETEFIDMSKMLVKDYTSINFTKESVDEKNLLQPSKTKSNRHLIDPLFELFNKNISKRNHEILQLIVSLYVDFRQLNIIDKLDDVLGMLLVYALVSRHFSVFKYVSFFDKLLLYKENWHRSFDQAKFYWDSGYPNIDELFTLLVNIVEKAYMELNSLAYIYEFELTLSKTESIENTIFKLKEVFTKEDVRKANPNVSETTIDRTLKRLKDERIIMPLGRGRSTKWQRLVSGNKKASDLNDPTLFD